MRCIMPPHWPQAGPRSRPTILAGTTGGVSVSEAAGLTAGERVVGLVDLDPSRPGGGPGLVTARGVVKRVVPDAPPGRDEWEVVRLADGDEAVRTLIADRVPLYRFVLDNMLTRYDLERGDQRVDAVREAVTLATAIRDKSKIDELLRVTEGARLALLNLEEMKTDELDRIKEGFVELGRRNKGGLDDPSRSSTAGA